MFNPTQRLIRTAAAVIFISTGIGHFVLPRTLAKFVPPYLPAAMALVLLSGVFELAGGIGLLLPRFRRAAAFGLSALLVAILPANIYMVTNPAEAGLAGVPVALFWIRIIMLPMMIWGLLWSTEAAK